MNALKGLFNDSIEKIILAAQEKRFLWDKADRNFKKNLSGCSRNSKTSLWYSPQCSLCLLTSCTHIDLRRRRRHRISKYPINNISSSSKFAVIFYICIAKDSVKIRFGFGVYVKGVPKPKRK